MKNESFGSLVLYRLRDEMTCRPLTYRPIFTPTSRRNPAVRVVSLRRASGKGYPVDRDNGSLMDGEPAYHRLWRLTWMGSTGHPWTHRRAAFRPRRSVDETPS